jgi:hypothetical protein
MHFLHSQSTEAHVRKAWRRAFSEPDLTCSSTVIYYGYLKDDLSFWKQAKFDPGRNTHAQKSWKINLDLFIAGMILKPENFF